MTKQSASKNWRALMKKPEKDENMVEPITPGAEWENGHIDRQWDEFLAWCKEQEHCTHE